MDNFNEWFRGTSAVGGDISVWQTLAALLLSFFLSLVLAYIYRQTHRGVSYSVSFVHSMILMGITVTLIMIVIGSNIARAFSLVGALSIIRFRTAIKEPRDVAFLFATMAVGMAAGTGFYDLAILFTLFVAPAVYFLYRFQIGSQPTSEVLLKVQIAGDQDHRTLFQPVFYEHLSQHSLLSIETIQGGAALELVYSIHMKPQTSENELMNALRALNGNRKVVLLSGAQNVDV
jgi:uncharacterized membrane protein YhiD involved in acid resistance